MTRTRKGGPAVVGYCRLSKAKGEDGLGLAAQRKAINDQAKKLGLPVASMHVEDGVSGAAPIDKRLGLLDALNDLRAGDRLVVAKRDRLGRDVLVVGWIDKEARRRGAEILSADGTGNGTSPTDRLLAQIVDAFAQYERAVIAARIKAALRQKWERGQSMTGTIRYGYKDVGEGQIKTDRHEQSVIKSMVRLRSQGHSLRDVSARLARRGWVQRNGRPFAAKTVRTIVERES